MYQRILVPVDGSQTSFAGLREAIKLAKDQQATLRLVHVVDEFVMDSAYPPAYDFPVFQQALRETGQRTLDKGVAMASEQGITAEAHLVETIGGNTAELIVTAARQWPADLIVMGTHGRRGVRRLLMGSDAGLVVHTSPVPVLMIRGTPTNP
jgi:nucleotide-binding universal stress UspA family protein